MTNRNAFLRVFLIIVALGVTFGSFSSCGGGGGSGGGGGGGAPKPPVCNDCPTPADPRCTCVIPDDHSNQPLGASLLPLPGSRPGEIEVPGDVDYFRVTVQQQGTLAIYTRGGLFTQMDLFDRSGTNIATSTSGEELSFRIDDLNALGTYYVSVRARFSLDAGTYTVHAQLDVHPTNRAPVRTGKMPAHTLTVGDSDTVNVAGFFDDPDGDRLTFTTDVDRPGVATAAVSGERVTLRGVERGSTTVRVIATDPGGLSATQEFTVEVQEEDRDPIDDFNVGIPRACPREVELCVRDHQCEDGDEIRVSVNGNEVFSGELFNAAYCQAVPVREGTNSVELFAINGTGFKGPCDYSDVNTGEITIRGSTTSVETQTWSHSGGTGSRANLNVTVGTGSGNCLAGGNNAPERRGSISARTLMEGDSDTLDVTGILCGSRCRFVDLRGGVQ